MIQLALLATRWSQEWRCNSTLWISSHSGFKPQMPPDHGASSWSKQPQRHQTHFPCPSISARMRKRRAFADKELENVMLEHELRHGELKNDFSALMPLLHHPPLPISPGLHCCTKDSSSAGTSSCVPVYKYKPLCECGLQFYELFHLRSRSSTGGDYNDFLLCQSHAQHVEDKEVQNSWKHCGKKHQMELIPLPSQQRVKNDVNTVPHVGFVKPSSKQTEMMDSEGYSATTVSILRSDQSVLTESDILAHNRTFEARTLAAQGWTADPRSTQSSPRADSEKSPQSGSVRTPTVRPLPFSVEALLRAWQTNGKQTSVHFVMYEPKVKASRVINATLYTCFATNKCFKSL